MRNTICALLIGLFSLTAFGQADKTAPKYDLTRPNPKTTAEINSMTRMQEGSEAWNTDTDTMWRYVNGVWIDTGSGTIADGSITEAKLNTSVNASLDLADSALQSGDNVSELVNDAYVALTGNQTVDDNKTFADGVILNSSLGASNDETYLLFKNAGATNLQVGGSTGFSSIYFQDDGTLSISRNTVLTGVDHARFAFEDLTGVRTYTFPDASGTIALTSDIGAATGDLWSDPVDSDILSDGDGTRSLGSISNRFSTMWSIRVDASQNVSTSEIWLTPASDPVSLADGVVYYDTEDQTFYGRANGTLIDLGATGSVNQSSNYTWTGNHLFESVSTDNKFISFRTNSFGGAIPIRYGAYGSQGQIIMDGTGLMIANNLAATGTNLYIDTSGYMRFRAGVSGNREYNFDNAYNSNNDVPRKEDLDNAIAASKNRNHLIKNKTADATLTATDQYDDGSVILTVQTADTLTLTIPNRSGSVDENYFFKVTNDDAQLNVAPDTGVTLSGDGFGSNTHFRINGRGDVDCIEITDGVFDCNGYNLTPYTPSSGAAPTDIEWTYDGVTQTAGNFQIVDGTVSPSVSFTVTDADVGDTFTYTLGNCNQTGFEAELYTIDGGAGTLTLGITVDFDNPNPAGNANNLYGVDVLVEDSFGNVYCENFYFEVIENTNLYAEGDAADPNNETDSMSANWTGSTAYRTSQSTYASTGTYGILSGNVNNAGFSSTDIDITGLNSSATHTVSIDASQVQGTSGRIYIADVGTTTTMTGVTASNPVNLSDTPGFNTYTFTIPSGNTGLRIRVLHVDANPANADTVIDAGEEWIAFDNIIITENP